MQIEKINIKDIKENNENPRKIDEEKFEKLVKSIKEFPEMLDVRPPVVDENNMILGGNMRKKAIIEAGLTEVPIMRVKDWTEKQKREFIIKDNLSFGNWDWDKLSAQYEGQELVDWGFNESELGMDLSEPEEKDDEVPETPEEPKSKLGDLYELGNGHRVLCGDSTKIEDVEKLMNGQKADMVFTDPPYGIGYEYNEHKDTTGEEYLTFCDDWFNTIQTLEPKYTAISTGWKYQKYWWNKDPRDCMYWIAKNKQTGGTAFHFRRVEPIFIWGEPNKKYDFDFFEELTERISGLRESHTCPKPVSLITSFIEKGVDYKNLVVDIFLGSGTTLIASEKTNRKCYGMEIDPRYVDTIVERWCQFTGITDIKKNGEPYKWELQEDKT